MDLLFLIDLLLTVLLHELAHVIAAAACQSPVEGIKVSGMGFVLRRGFSSYRTDAIVAAAGPIVNITLSILFAFAAKYGLFKERAYLFAGLNLLTGLYNLLPALPMDGGVILYSLLALKMDGDRAGRIANGAALVCGTILVILGLDIVVKTRYNSSILAGGAMIIGGTYAKGAGKDPAEGHKARALRRR